MRWYQPVLQQASMPLEGKMKEAATVAGQAVLQAPIGEIAVAGDTRRVAAGAGAGPANSPLQVSPPV